MRTAFNSIKVLFGFALFGLAVFAIFVAVILSVEYVAGVIGL
jgi:hypothetical protein